MTEPLSAAVISQFNPAQLALFLDFDGTLVEMASRPHLVELAPEVLRDIESMHSGGGAVAIITGREIAEIDRFFAPLVLPVAGVHGLVRRRADGGTQQLAAHEDAIGQMHDSLLPFARQHPSLLLERKQGSVALHYRLRPELEQVCRDAMEQAVAGLEDLRILRGKMVIEAKAAAADKGVAVAAFLEEPPFSGKVPVFAGDDVTDEDAFAEVNRLNGISIKVGTGDTVARYRVADVLALHGLLRELAGRIQTQPREQKPA